MQRAVATTMMHRVFCDSHCHIRLASQKEAEAHCAAATATAAGASHAAVTSLVLCGTHPQIDWDLVETAVTNTVCTRRLIGFGVHPWFVPASSPRQSFADAAVEDEENLSTGCCCADSSSTGNSLPANAVAGPHLSLPLLSIAEDLAERLERNPAAIVAEIGLDKLRGPPEAAQTAAFHLQLRIAAAHHRPVSVHCVRHYGLLLRILQDLPAEDTPPAIILHAFTGSLEIAKSLLSLKNKKPARPMPADEPRKSARRGGASADAVRIKERIFFGVGLATSFAVKNFGTQTLPLLLQSQRVLLETDAHYSGEAGWGSVRATDDCGAQTCVYVNAQQHAEQLREVMKAIEAAALQSAELVKAAEDSGVTADEVARNAVAAAYTNAFRSVLL